MYIYGCHLNGCAVVEGVFLQVVAYIRTVAVLQVQGFVALSESDTRDSRRAIGYIQMQVCPLLPYTACTVVVDQVAGNESRSRVARTERLQMAQDIEELRCDVVQPYLRLYMDSRL